MACIVSLNCVTLELSYGRPHESIKGVRHWTKSLEYASDIPEVIDVMARMAVMLISTLLYYRRLNGE